jgi:ketosteroid isomerase-like protein
MLIKRVHFVRMTAEVFMRNWIFALFILAISSSITFGQAQTKPQAGEKVPQTKSTKVKPDADAKSKKKTDATDEFNTLLTEYYKAWNTLNVSNPAKYYSQQPGLIFYDIAPLQYKGWKEYQAGVSKLFQGFTSFQLIPNKDINVTRRGKVAWTTMTLHVSGKQKDGKPMELEARHTAIWEKTKSKWVIVHEHISAPLPSAGQ